MDKIGRFRNLDDDLNFLNFNLKLIKKNCSRKFKWNIFVNNSFELI